MATESRPASLTARIWREALRSDVTATTPWQGLRVASGVVIALLAGTAGGSYAVGAAAAGGALSAGLSSIDVEGRQRTGRMLATVAGMSAATWVGSATGDVTWVHILLAAAWAAAGGLLAVVEPSLTGVGVNAVIAFLVFGRFAATPGDALRTAGFVAAGGAVQVALATFLRRPARLRRETRLLGDAYHALAAYAASLPAGGGSASSAAGAIEMASSAVANSSVQGPAREAWETLAAQGGRVRLQLIDLAEVRLRAGRGSAAPVDIVLDAAAAVLRAIGHALSTGRPGHAVDEARARLASVSPAGASGGAGVMADHVAASVDALGGQLRAAAASVGDAVVELRRLDRVTAVPRSLNRQRRVGAEVATRMLANLHPRSAAMRHALRLAGAITAATLIAHLVGLQRGYWIGVTAAIVLRPDFATTFSRGLSRAAGTMLGVGVASLLAVTVHPEGVLLGLLVGAFTAAAGGLLFASYLAFSVAITGTVVFLLATVDPNPVADAEERLLATAIGAALALLSYAAWPTWGRTEALEAIADLCQASGGYASAVLEVAADRSSAARSRLGDLDRRMRLARSNAEAAVQQSLADPAFRRLDGRWAAELLTSLRRAALAAHALRARVEAADWVPRAEARRPAAAIREALAAAARAGRAGVPPTLPDPALRRVHNQLVSELEASGQRGGEATEWLIDQVDEMVDAVDTVLEVLTASPTGRAVTPLPAAPEVRAPGAPAPRG